MKQRNRVLFCCMFLSSVLLFASSTKGNSNVSYLNNNDELTFSKVSSNTDVLQATTLTYDFGEVNAKSNLGDVSAPKLNNLDDNVTDYLSDVEVSKVWFGDSSSGQSDVVGLKFGSSSVIGSLKLSFKQNVKSVKIYGTGYKTYKSAFVINGEKTVLTAQQGEEPNVIEYNPTKDSPVLTIETSTDKIDGYGLLRAWMTKLIVEVSGGEVIENPISSIKCASTYKLKVDHTLRLQAFDGTKVINGVKWAILSGEEFGLLQDSRLTGIKAGTMVIEGSYPGFEPVHMTVYVGTQNVKEVYLTVSELKNYFEASGDNIVVKNDFLATVFTTSGSIVSFVDGTSGKDFYLSDGKSTFLVYNTGYSRDSFSLGDNVVITGTLNVYHNMPEFSLRSANKSLNKYNSNIAYSGSIGSYAQFNGLTSSVANRISNVFKFYSVKARFDSLVGNDINMFFTDNPTKLITIHNATSFESTTSIESYAKGNDIIFNAVLSINTDPQFNYTSYSMISASDHVFTGSLTGLSFSTSSLEVALNKTINIGNLVSYTGAGDFNKGLDFVVDNTDYATVTANGNLTIINDEANVGEVVNVTVTSQINSALTATLPLTIIKLKSSSIILTGLGIPSNSYSSGIDKVFTITDDAQTITVAYDQIGNYGSGIQMNKRTSPLVNSGIYNTAACSYYIDSITLYATDTKTIDTSVLNVFGSNSAFTVSVPTEQLITTESSNLGIIAEYSFGDYDFEYFKIQHTSTSRAIYLKEIRISYKQ